MLNFCFYVQSNPTFMLQTFPNYAIFFYWERLEYAYCPIKDLELTKFKMVYIHIYI